MNIINSYIEEIKDNLILFEENLNKLNNKESSFSDNDKLKRNIKELVNSIESDISSLKLEYKDFNKDQNLKSLFQKYDQLKLQFDKIKLFDNNKSFSYGVNDNEDNRNSPKINLKSNETKDRITKLNKMQENNLKMIRDARLQISEMSNMAMETNIELRRQTEQMKNMERKFDEIDGKLDQSNKTVDKMLKRWF